MLVGEGVKTVGEMKRHLQQHVKHELFKDRPCPSRTNRRFYPKNVDIRNHMYRATVKHMLSKIDQENLEKKVELWKKNAPEDSIFFRPCSVASEDGVGGTTTEQEKNNVEPNISQKLFFAYQTVWQRRLMLRYGNEITLLDATYKTTRYELPLFFLVVKTNVNYAVVGVFVIQNETTADIIEALQLFQKWNPAWNPKYFMTDFCQEEISSIEAVFKGKENSLYLTLYIEIYIENKIQINTDLKS